MDGQTCNNNSCTCTQDSQCTTTQSCQNGKCQEVVCDGLTCGSNAKCAIANNAASCQCESGFHAVTSAEAGCGKWWNGTFFSFDKIVQVSYFQLTVLRTSTAVVDKVVKTICVHVLTIQTVLMRNHVRMENVNKLAAIISLVAIMHSVPS